MRLQSLALYLIIFTQMLDTSVTNLSLTKIASDLKLDVYYASWIMTSFGTGLVISFSLGNLLLKRYSADMVLLIGCTAFTLASLGCGMSSTAEEFLFYRFLQGLSSGMSVVTSQSLLLRIYGPERKAMAVSLWGSAFSLAPVVGPLVGAWITSHFTWHWLFLINIPLISLCVFILLPVLQPEKNNERIDKKVLLTLILFSVFISSLQYTVDFGEQQGWMGSEIIQATVAIAIAFMFLFTLSNQKTRLFDFSIFKDIRYASATIASCLGNGLIFSSLILLPIWLQKDYEMPMLTAGIVVSVASAVAVIFVPMVGKYLPAKHFTLAAVLSLIFSAMSFGMMSFFTVDTSMETMIWSRLIGGLGLSIFTMPLTMISLQNIPQEKVANANAVSMMLRVVSANLFVGASFYYYLHYKNKFTAEIASNMDATTIAKYQQDFSPEVIGYISKLASTNAMAEIFSIIVMTFVAATVMMLPFLWKRNYPT